MSYKECDRIFAILLYQVSMPVLDSRISAASVFSKMANGSHLTNTFPDFEYIIDPHMRTKFI